MIAREIGVREIFLDEEDRHFFLKACVGGLRSNGVEGASMGADGQPLSPVHRDTAGEPRRGDEMVAEHVSETLRRTEWKSLMKRLPRRLAEDIDEERN